MARDNESLTDAQIYEKLSRFCEYQERSVQDVQKKMFALQVAKDRYLFFIEKLQEDKFLDEQRYLKSFILGKFKNKKWGVQKIANALRAKGIKAPIQEFLQTEIEEEDYLETLKNLAEKKRSSIRSTNPAEIRLKLFKFLKSKGYESDKIKEVLKG